MECLDDIERFWEHIYRPLPMILTRIDQKETSKARQTKKLINCTWKNDMEGDEIKELSFLWKEFKNYGNVI